jgi:hypothetical protein
MVGNLWTGCRRTLPRRYLEGVLLLLPGWLLERRAGIGRRRPWLWQVFEQNGQLRPSFRLERPAHPVVELRSIYPSLRHVLLQKSDRFVTIGIADAGLDRSLCRVGWLVLRRLGWLRLGRGRLTHNPQYPRPEERRNSRPASATNELDHTEHARAGPKNADRVPTKINRQLSPLDSLGVEQEPVWAA